MKQRLASSLEALESRIAPAALSTAGVLSYVDLNGNHVSVTISKGTVAATDFTFSVASPFSAGNADTPMQLEAITLAGSGFTGANIAVKVTKAAAGSGVTAVGLIDATGIDLGAVSIAGDLGAILAGSNGSTNVAIKSLTVHSVGDDGTATQASGSPTLTSMIEGRLGGLTVGADINNDATIDVSDGANAGMGAVTIGGSLDGGIESSGGTIGVIAVKGVIDGGGISAAGSIAGVKVSGSFENGQITDSAGSIRSLSVGGSLFGYVSASNGATIGAVNIRGELEDGGDISGSGNIGAVHIGGSLSYAGIYIGGPGSIASVTIGGSVNAQSDVQTTNGNIGPVKIGLDISDDSAIESGGALGAVTIGGDVVGGVISAEGTLGAVKIAGSVTKGSSITSVGSIASISVAGSVNDSNILAGAKAMSTKAVNIGAITVGGDWIGSNLSAGGEAGTSGSYGDASDTLVAASSTITSIVIGGIIDGDPTSSAHFGFDAESIGKFEFDHATLKLPTARPSNLPLTPILGDVAIELV